MNEKVRAWLAALEVERFHGSVTCKVENGRVTYVRVEQGFKPEELKVQSGDPGNNERNS
jgi:hypothetical protein